MDKRARLATTRPGSLTRTARAWTRQPAATADGPARPSAGEPAGRR
ncbi:hypothetical protein [Pseudonocardia acidicola]|uniref:Uncharacterized protein n=1 Tax=Pseudonocardia acidicola TaxID=2724939 RepID=A0ABX1S7S8_9PSEU|nr:hypothetical protein [Pseudonocardia acidicola]NMH97615.1 hypothetical protein [Pseudonocardia acidicola]